MKRAENDKWLDDALGEVIGSEKSEPSFEEWKREHPKAVEMLASRAGQNSSAGQPNIWQMIYKSKITRLAAAAAVIIIVIGLSLVQRGPSEQIDSPSVPKVTNSPAELPTVASLNIAYRKGGMDAVERQCEKAFERLEQRPANITLRELLAEFNGT